MTKMKMESKLHDMIGKLYTYKLKEHRVIRYKCETSFSKIVTDKEDIIINHDEASDFFDQFLMIDEENPVVSSQELMHPGASSQLQLPRSTIQESCGDLSAIIMENIKKVKEDKEFIPQANAINEQLKSLIELGKTEVDLIKAQVGFMRFSKGGDLY